MFVTIAVVCASLEPLHAVRLTAARNAAKNATASFFLIILPSPLKNVKNHLRYGNRFPPRQPACSARFLTGIPGLPSYKPDPGTRSQTSPPEMSSAHHWHRLAGPINILIISRKYPVRGFPICQAKKEACKHNHLYFTCLFFLICNDLF